MMIWQSESLFPFFDILYVFTTFYNLVSIAYEVDDFEPNHTNVMVWKFCFSSLLT